MDLFFMIICVLDGIVVGAILSSLVKLFAGDNPFGRLLNILSWIVGLGYFILTLAVIESNDNLILGISIIFGPTVIAIIFKLMVYVIGNNDKN